MSNDAPLNPVPLVCPKLLVPGYFILTVLSPNYVPALCLKLGFFATSASFDMGLKLFGFSIFVRLKNVRIDPFRWLNTPLVLIS